MKLEHKNCRHHLPHTAMINFFSSECQKVKRVKTIYMKIVKIEEEKLQVFRTTR